MPKRYFANVFGDVLPSTTSPQHWREKALNLVKLIIRKYPANASNCDGGIYVGVGGVAYALWYAASKQVFAGERNYLLSEAQKIINFHIQFAEHEAKNHHKDEASFILGGLGVYATGALIHTALGNPVANNLLGKFRNLVQVVIPQNFRSTGGDELFVGRAGYLCGVLNLQQKLGVPIIDESKLRDVCHSTVESGRHHSRLYKHRSPLMYIYHDTEYLGAAHGLCSILQMLISFPHYLQIDTKAAVDIKATIDYLVSLQLPNGNFPCSMDEVDSSARPPEDELIHWCHGAPGTIYLLAKAYLTWKEAKYLEACKKCAAVIWEKGLLKKGPGICHGIPGNAYAFLLMHRLTGDQMYLNRALRFAEFMDSEAFKAEARTPDSPYSLFEGLAGTLCFYVDLCDPMSAEFPLFPVF